MFDLNDPFDTYQQTDIAHPIKHIQDWKPVDTDGDGVISGADIPFPAGSLEAKAAWQKIELIAYSPASIAKAKALGYTDAKGMYAGKPLCPGKHIMDGDTAMMRDRLMYRDGYDLATAKQVLSKMYDSIPVAKSP